MNANSPTSARPNRRLLSILKGEACVYPAALLLLCLALYFWRLGVVPLEDFDEAYYAAGAREMLERGDLGTPYFNGRPFLLKPALIYWLIAGAFHFLGPTEFAARVGCAFLGTAVVLMTYWFGACTLGRRAGFLAGLALALSYMWVDIARDASIDIPLTAFLSGALFITFLATKSDPRRARWLYLGAYPLLGLALLAKGPVPTGVVLVGVAAFLLAARRLRRTLGEAQLLPGLLLLLLVAAPWYWYEIRHQPAFFATFFVAEHLGHIGGELARTEPVWGNLKYLLIYFYPWVAFLPAALVHAFRQPDKTHVLRFASWWALAVVALFSIPQSKLAHYLAPAFPPIALLVGAWLDGRLRGHLVTRTWAALGFALLALVGAVCLAGAAVAAALPPSVHEAIAGRYGSWPPGLAPVAMLGAIGLGSLVAVLAARSAPRAVAPALALAMLTAALAHVGWFKPHLAEIQARPRKELARLAARLLPPPHELGVYYAKRNTTVFYFPRPITDLGEAEEAFPEVVRFLSPSRPAALLTHAKFLPRLEQSGVQISVLGRRGDYVLVANGLP